MPRKWKGVGTKSVNPSVDGKVVRGASDLLRYTKGYCYCCVAMANLGGQTRARKPMSGSSARIPNNGCSSRRRAEPSPPRVHMDCRRGCVLRQPRASSVRTRAPPGPFLLLMEPGWGICPRAALLAAHLADKPTAEDIRIDVPVRCAHDLGTCSSSSSSSSSSRRRRR